MELQKRGRKKERKIETERKKGRKKKSKRKIGGWWMEGMNKQKKERRN